MKQLWAPWRMTYIEGEDPVPDGCLLCLIDGAGKDETHHVVERAEFTFTLLNRFPYSSGHVMVVPHSHITELGGLDEAGSAALLRGAARATEALTLAMRAQGFNIGVNQGTAAGASLGHVHLHVVPRWNGDTNFMPVLGDVKVLPDHLEATAAKLRQAYAELAAR